MVSAFKDSNGMAREYFTLIGTLSGSQRGWSLLKKDLFGWLSALAQQGEEDLRSAALTCLDYSKYVYTFTSIRLHQNTTLLTLIQFRRYGPARPMLKKCLMSPDPVS